MDLGPYLHPGRRCRPGVAPVSRCRCSQAGSGHLRLLAANHSSRHPALRIRRGKRATPDTSRISHGYRKKAILSRNSSLSGRTQKICGLSAWLREQKDALLRVMYTNETSTIWMYTPAAGFSPSWQPTIQNWPSSINKNQTYTNSGYLFNGMSQANFYGDDMQNATNYPLVQVTMNGSGHVYY